MEDPVPYIPGRDASDCSSAFDQIAPWSDMNTVRFRYGGNTNVAVRIPKFWYKVDKTGSEFTIRISNSPKSAQDGFKVSPGHRRANSDNIYIARYKSASSSTDYASNTGKTIANLSNMSFSDVCDAVSVEKSGRHLLDIQSYYTVCMLYLVEYANWNTQAVIGRGCGKGGSRITGSTDNMPYHTGSNNAPGTYGVGIQYRHIEDLWAMAFEYVYGIKIVYDGESDHICYIDTDAMSYDGIITDTSFDAGYVKDVDVFGVDGCSYKFIIPSEIGATSTTYLCDYFQFNNQEENTNQVLRIGGYDNSTGYGLFYWNFNRGPSDYGGVGTSFRVVWDSIS